VSDEECSAIAATFSEATGEAVDADTLAVYVNDAASMLEGEGADARFAQVGDLITDPDQRHAALLVASVVAWRDGGVGAKQGLALQKLTRAFGMEISELHKIMAQAKQQFG
jgi:tellurite resistance protein